MEGKIRTIIIDDENLAREVIKNYLSSYTNIEVVGECNNGYEGVKMIKAEDPDLIFLDVQMPKLSGFEMLELLENIPEVIFSTAYDQYALQAFELSASDYLLKPYSKDRFDTAVQKVIDRMKRGEKPATEPPQPLPSGEGEFLDRIVVKIGSRIHLIPVEDILRIEAMDDYVSIHTASQKHLKQLTMKYLESHLSPQVFVRTHRSHIVAVDQINRLEHYEKESHVVVLKNGDTVPVSRSGYGRLKEVLKI